MNKRQRRGLERERQVRKATARYAADTDYIARMFPEGMIELSDAAMLLRQHAMQCAGQFEPTREMLNMPCSVCGKTLTLRMDDLIAHEAPVGVLGGEGVLPGNR